MDIDFTGYDVIIQNSETEETLVVGKVERFDRRLNLIEVGNTPKEEMEQMKLSVFLFHGGKKAYRYMGTFRKGMTVNSFGVALFKGSQKEDRKNERFPIRLDGVIIDHKKPDGKPIVEKNIPIHIVDISRSGLRVEGEGLNLHIQDRLAILCRVTNQVKIFYAEVVRIGGLQDDNVTADYGCELLSQTEYNL